MTFFLQVMMLSKKLHTPQSLKQVMISSARRAPLQALSPTLHSTPWEQLFYFLSVSSLHLEAKDKEGEDAIEKRKPHHGTHIHPLHIGSVSTRSFRNQTLLHQHFGSRERTRTVREDGGSSTEAFVTDMREFVDEERLQRILVEREIVHEEPVVGHVALGDEETGEEPRSSETCHGERIRELVAVAAHKNAEEGDIGVRHYEKQPEHKQEEEEGRSLRRESYHPVHWETEERGIEEEERKEDERVGDHPGRHSVSSSRGFPCQDLAFFQQARQELHCRGEHERDAES